jgi:hypothetical protein
MSYTSAADSFIRDNTSEVMHESIICGIDRDSGWTLSDGSL